MNFSLACVFIAVAFGACNMFNEYFNLENDHPAEEILEDVIEHHTGVDIDLSGDEER